MTSEINSFLSLFPDWKSINNKQQFIQDLSLEVRKKIKITEQQNHGYKKKKKKENMKIIQNNSLWTDVIFFISSKIKDLSKFISIRIVIFEREK